MNRGLIAILLLTASAAAQSEQPAPVAVVTAEQGSSSYRLNMTYQSAFRAPTDKGQAQAPKSELQTLIDQLNQMKIEPDTRTTGLEEMMTEPAQELQPIEQIELEPVVAQDVLDEIRSADPGQIANPLLLAEALFRGGHRNEAYTFYELCLLNTEDPSDQAWLLYQMANCRIYSDPAQAEELFRRVISEYGDSDWVKVSEAQVELMEWTKQTRPRHYLASLKARLEGKPEPKIEDVQPVTSVALSVPTPQATEANSTTAEMIDEPTDSEDIESAATQQRSNQSALLAIEASLKALEELDTKAGVKRD